MTSRKCSLLDDDNCYGATGATKQTTEALLWKNSAGELAAPTTVDEKEYEYEGPLQPIRR